MKATSRSGWSMIEMMVSLLLVALLLGKGAMVMDMMRTTAGQQPAAMAVEDQANALVDRIALAILGSDRDALFPQFQNPVHTSSLRYSVSLGVQDGEVVWDDPEEIALQNGGQVVWRENPDAADERRVVWTNLARPFLEGEVMNGIDDNGNGLIDETGLSFVLFRNSVTIRLSLGRALADGEQVTRTVQTVVTVRNRTD